jgi:hypothetical protein
MNSLSLFYRCSSAESEARFGNLIVGYATKDNLFLVQCDLILFLAEVARNGTNFSQRR